jgi:RNA polymerase sigma-70 factor, ECF subfamily
LAHIPRVCKRHFGSLGCCRAIIIELTVTDARSQSTEHTLFARKRASAADCQLITALVSAIGGGELHAMETRCSESQPRLKEPNQSTDVAIGPKALGTFSDTLLALAHPPGGAGSPHSQGDDSRMADGVLRSSEITPAGGPSMPQLPHHSIDEAYEAARPAIEPVAAAEVDATAPFADIVRTYSGYIWRVLRCLGVPEADVDDLCQETFLVVHRKLGSFEGRSALRSWIYGIAFRVVSDYRGRAHRRHELVTDKPPERAAVGAQEADLERTRDWALLDRLLAQLADDQRQVFVLYEVEELSMREISEIVKCPVQTAYSRLHAARKRIAQALAELRSQEAES